MDSYNAWVSDVVMGAEAFGAAIMVLGGLFVFIHFSAAELLFRDQRARVVSQPSTEPRSRNQCRTRGINRR